LTPCLDGVDTMGHGKKKMVRPVPRARWPFHDLGVELSLAEISWYAMWGLADDCR